MFFFPFQVSVVWLITCLIKEEQAITQTSGEVCRKTALLLHSIPGHVHHGREGQCQHEAPAAGSTMAGLSS